MRITKQELSRSTGKKLALELLVVWAILLGLLSSMALPAALSSALPHQIRSGTVTNDTESPAPVTTATILVPLRAEVAIVWSQPDSPATTVDFDHDASGNFFVAPCLFRDAAPLREKYAPLGIHFLGPDANSGGAVLADCGNFGVPAASDFNFLAFNRSSHYNSGGTATDPETIIFDSLKSPVSLLASAGFVSGTFQIQGFDANDLLVATDVETAPIAMYVRLQVAASAGIKRLVLTRTDSNTSFGVVAFVIDDLSFNEVPFDTCIQDDSSGSFFQFNSGAGTYQFTSCSGITIGGTASVSRKGNIITLQQNGPDRRILARVDQSQNRGTASVQLFAQNLTFTITDRNTADDTCTCH